MQGYSSVFDRSTQLFSTITDPLPIFETFRSQFNIYGFIDNGDREPDTEAILISAILNPRAYADYYERTMTKKLLGYVSPPTHFYNQLDSRHIMMSVHLFTKLPEPVQTIVEIGGGFGNWLRLNSTLQPFSKWTIIDLPHLNQLQQWYLDSHEITGYELVSAEHSAKWSLEQTGFDLVIGTHSLSEFSLEIFQKYFETVISKTKYLYYAYHNVYPEFHLIQAKRNMIDSEFELIHSMTSQHGEVTNALYKKRT